MSSQSSARVQVQWVHTACMKDLQGVKVLHGTQMMP